MFEKLKSILLFLFFLVVAVIGFIFVATPESKKEGNSLELSVGGEVHTYPFPQGAIIHVIADENQNLTDIQVFLPNGGNQSVKPTNTTWPTSKHDN